MICESRILFTYLVQLEKSSVVSLAEDLHLLFYVSIIVFIVGEVGYVDRWELCLLTETTVEAKSLFQPAEQFFMVAGVLKGWYLEY